MRSPRSRFPVFFAFVMLICVLFVIWFVPALNERRFMLQDIRRSIETSQGRERKQQYEYDETVAVIPEVQAELDRVVPLNDAAVQEVATLKEERKLLRQEKADLESLLSVSGEPEEVTGDE